MFITTLGAIGFVIGGMIPNGAIMLLSMVAMVLGTSWALITH